MKIALDFGDVIQDVGRLKSLIIKELFGTSIPNHLCHKEYVVGTGILNERQYLAIQSLAYCTKAFGTSITCPIDGALPNIRKLQQEGHKLTIITARGEYETKIAYEWMETRGLLLPFVSVGIDNYKTEVCKGFDVLFESDLEQLIHCPDVPHRFLCAINDNLEVEPPEGVTKVYAWNQFYQEIRNVQRSIDNLKA